jgi:hypothetical protein
MNLDEIQATWKDYDRRLEAALRLNRQLLDVGTLARARSALRRQRLLAMLGAVTNAMVIPLVGFFIALNYRLLAFVLPAIAIDVYFIIKLVVHGRQVHLLSNLDYVGPVVDIQRRIDEVVRLRLGFARWLTMSTVLMWVPVSIVVFKAFLGWSLYVIAPAWLIVNTLVGLCCIPLVFWIRKVPRDRLPAGFLRAVAGENLTAASTFLTALSDFERKEMS